MEEKIEDNGGERANSTIRVTASAFPHDLFDEWNKDSINRFGNCRWIDRQRYIYI